MSSFTQSAHVDSDSPLSKNYNVHKGQSVPFRASKALEKKYGRRRRAGLWRAEVPRDIPCKLLTSRMYTRGNGDVRVA